MSSVFHERIATIKKQWITPYLKERKFKVKGNLYSFQKQTLEWIIDIQTSRWNTAAAGSLTLNCGVYVPGVVSTYVLNDNFKEKKGIETCCVYSRLGILVARQDKWWTVKVDDAINADEVIGTDILKDLKEGAFSFFQRFKTKYDVIDFLTRTRPSEYKDYFPMSEVICLCYAAILYKQLGDNDKCQNTLEKAFKVKNDSLLDEVLINLRERLLRQK